MQKFRFGLMSRGAETGALLREKARKAEALGYHSLLFNDHYVGPGEAMAAARHPIQPMAAIPAAAVAGEVTESMVIGFRVLCIDYHNPTVLAKQLATLDVLNDGRTEIGLGAGWIESEYAAMGIQYDRPGKRIARLEEVVELLDQSFAGGPVHVEGTHGVHATGYEAVPKPVQKPRPTISIGGGGPKILSLAARRADVVSFNLNNSAGRLGPEGARSATADATLEKVDIVRQAAGERFADLTLEVGAFFTVVTDDALGCAEQLPASTNGMLDLPAKDLLEHPHVLVGTVEEICDRLIERRERYGFSYTTIRQDTMEAFAPVVERLAGQ